MALTINTKINNDADGYSLDASQVKGTYVVVANESERNSLPESTRVTGTKVYQSDVSKEYRWNGTSWEEITADSLPFKVNSISREEGGVRNSGYYFNDGSITEIKRRQVLEVDTSALMWEGSKSGEWGLGTLTIGTPGSTNLTHYYTLVSCTGINTSTGKMRYVVRDVVPAKNPTSKSVLTVTADGTIAWEEYGATVGGVSNIKDGSGSSALNQIQDGTTGTFDFTNKNPNAYALDNLLTGQIEYGGVGAFSTAFGGKSQASGKRSFAAGTTTIAKGAYSAAFGDNSVALGNDSFVANYQNTVAGVASAAFGQVTIAEGEASFTEGTGSVTKSSLPSSSSGGSGSGSGGAIIQPDTWDNDEHIGNSAHVEGRGGVAYGVASHVENGFNTAYGHLSHAGGSGSQTGRIVNGKIAGGKAAIVHGSNNKAWGNDTAVFGNGNTASADSSLISGYNNSTNNNATCAAVFGSSNEVLAPNSFTAGASNIVRGQNSVAFGYGNTVSGQGNGAIGIGLEATNVASHFVVGKYNKGNTSALFEVGGGSSAAHFNAFEVLNDGRAKVSKAPTESDDVVRKLELDAQKVTINSGASATGAANTITVGGTTYSLSSGGSNIANIADGTGAKAINQIINNSTTTIDVATKNPNAYALDNSLANTPIGATGESSATFGGNTAALSKRSMAIGTSTVAKGKYSLAAGDNSVTLGNDSAAFGYSTVAQGLASAAFGNATIATGENAHTEGFGTKANGYSAHAEGNLTIADANNSHAEGISTQATGYAAHSEGNLNVASGEHAHAEGYKNTASGNNSHAEGSETKAIGLNSHTEGWLSEANGNFSHVEGYKSSVKNTQYVKPSGGGSGSGTSGDAGDTDPSWKADDHRGEGSHASGILTQSSGYASHSEGLRTVADGHLSHAEGQQTYTIGWASHAEGNQTTAEGGGAHAEGGQTKATGINSHAEGTLTVAAGDSSHAEGNQTQANGAYSHAAGIGTIANGLGQFVVGRYNQPVGSNDIFVVGCGDGSTRRNALVVNNDGRLQVFRTPSNLNDVVRLTELNTKLDKTGGSITGNLTIGGNLVVNGTTSTVEATHLKVADKLIYVAKDNTTALTNPAGLITPKYDGTNNGGLVYDNTGTAYVGDITLDSNGNVDTTKSDLQPIATRAATTEFTDKHLVAWDATNNKLVDGGELADKFVGTDGITIDKAADSEKIEISGKNFVAKDTTHNYVVYGVGTKENDQVFILATSAPRVVVGNIPYYANPTNAGNTAVSATIPVAIPQQDYAAANKKYCDDNFRKAITDDGTYVYTSATNNPNSKKGCTYTPVAGNIPQWNSTKCIKSGTPVDDDDAANKLYVDNAIALYIDTDLISEV